MNKKTVLLLLLILLAAGIGIWYMNGIDSGGTESWDRYLNPGTEEIMETVSPEVGSDGRITISSTDGSNQWADRVELTIRGGIASGDFLLEVMDEDGNVVYRFHPAVGQEYEENTVLRNLGEHVNYTVSYLPGTEGLSGGVNVHIAVRQKRWRFYF